MKRSLGGTSMNRYFVVCLWLICLVNKGVVNAQLIVYDTTNVRVVDASILPMQLSAHLQSTLYGVAEKAADLIKAAQ